MNLEVVFCNIFLFLGFIYTYKKKVICMRKLTSYFVICYWEGFVSFVTDL
jgi:hypothetical protein